MCFQKKSPDPSVFPHHSHFPQTPYHRHCLPLLLPPQGHGTDNQTHHSSPAPTRGREGSELPAVPPCSPPCAQPPKHSILYTTIGTQCAQDRLACCAAP